MNEMKCRIMNYETFNLNKYIWYLPILQKNKIKDIIFHIQFILLSY